MPACSQYQKGVIKMKKERDKTQSTQEIAKEIRSESKIVTDILGSYTGTGKFDDKPEQDADDL